MNFRCQNVSVSIKGKDLRREGEASDYNAGLTPVKKWGKEEGPGGRVSVFNTVLRWTWPDQWRVLKPKSPFRGIRSVQE